MATVSFQQFSGGQPVNTLGNEGQVQKEESSNGASFFQRLSQDLKSRVQDVVTPIKTAIDTATDTNISPVMRAVGTVAELGKVPLRTVGAGYGAVADVIGEGINSATGNTELKPQEQDSQGMRTVYDIGNTLGGEIVGAVAKPIIKYGSSLLKDTPDIAKTAYDAIKTSNSNLTKKAVDFISADPEKKVQTILKESTPQELDNYLSIAEKASSDPRVATPFEVVGNKLSDTAKILQTKLSEIGKAKSDIIQPMREGLDSFKKETTPLIQKLTSLKNSFGEIEKGSKSKVQAIINDAKTVSTKLDADTFIDKVQNALYSGNLDMTIPRGSTLDKQLRGIIGEYNSSLKKALPKEYAQLNEQYSKLVDSLDTINRSLGEVVEGVPVRGASLIKQFFSPSGTKAKEIFDFVKKETNGQVDLAKDSTLAKFSMDLFDDPRSRSLLSGIGDIPTSVSGAVTKIAEKLGGDKLQGAMRTSTIRKATEMTKNIFERAKGLSSTDREVENKAFEKILNSEPSLLQAYKAKYGNEINADNFRPFFKDIGYNGANAAAVQEPSSYLAKKAYSDALKNKGDFATFSAGGSGAGKSSGIKSIPELSNLKNKSAVLLDSNLSSYSSAIKKIKQAEDAGKKFVGIYTYRDPIDSFVNGVVKRMNDNPEEMGRIVPTKVMAGNHIDSLEVVKKLIKDGYNFWVVDNSLGAGKAKLTTLEDIVKKAKYPSVQELTGILNRKAKELRDSGVITPEQYKEYIK